MNGFPCFNSSLEVWKPFFFFLIFSFLFFSFQQFLRGMETGGYVSFFPKDVDRFNSSLEVWKQAWLWCKCPFMLGFNSSLEVWKPLFVLLLFLVFRSFNSSLEVWKLEKPVEFLIKVACFNSSLEVWKRKKGLKNSYYAYKVSIVPQRYGNTFQNSQTCCEGGFQQFLRGMETMFLWQF